MIPSQRTALRALAILLVLAITQLYMPLAVAQQFIARLSSTKGGPVLVNGNAAPVPGSIPTGAEIQTGADTTATIDLPNIGELQVGPNTSLQITENGVVLRRGCIVLKKSESAAYDVQSPDGPVPPTDQNKRAWDVCYLDGKTIANQNAAQNAISGVGGSTGGGGISQGVLWAIVLVPIAGVVTWLILRNPSP